MKTKIIKDRLVKECSICGKNFKLVRYTDFSYRGGHYFGKFPISTKKRIGKSYGGWYKVVKDWQSYFSGFEKRSKTL
ncbi:MAG: hypothetical protein AAB965_02895 [Patescibacteria group bacterium]